MSDVDVCQVLLRWAVQHNCALLPKSANEARMRTNMEVRRNTDPCPATDGRQRQQGTFIYLLFTFLRAFHRLSPATAAVAAERVLVSADSIYSRPGECVST